MIDEEPLLWREIFSNQITDAESRDLAEACLLKEPQNVQVRARLLAHYRYSNNCADELKAQGRLRHVLWFIDNVPDWKFCGEVLFYFDQSDVAFSRVKDVWSEQIRKSNVLMRRINQFLLMKHAGVSDLPVILDSLKNDFGDSSWVDAIFAMDDPLRFWLQIIESVPSYKILKANSIDAREWELSAVKSETSPREIYELSVSDFLLRSIETELPCIAGYTWPRFHRRSILEFDPDLIKIRFLIAYWTISRIPASALTRSSFFMAPFSEPTLNCDFLPTKEYLRIPVENLAELWTTQIQITQDNAVMKNAKFFASRIQPMFPDLAKKLNRLVR